MTKGPKLLIVVAVVALAAGCGGASSDGGIAPLSAASVAGQANATPASESFDQVRRRLADTGLRPVSTPPAVGRVGALEVSAPRGSTVWILFFVNPSAANTYVNDDHTVREAVHEGRALVLRATDHVYLLAAGSTVTNAEQQRFDRVVEVGEGEAH